MIMDRRVIREKVDQRQRRAMGKLIRSLVRWLLEPLKVEFIRGGSEGGGNEHRRETVVVSM